MTLQEYIENLTKFAQENPEALNLKVVSSNGEGNGHSEVFCNPEKGVLNIGVGEGGEDEFMEEGAFEEGDLEEGDINAICID